MVLLGRRVVRGQMTGMVWVATLGEGFYRLGNGGDVQLEVCRDWIGCWKGSEWGVFGYWQGFQLGWVMFTLAVNGFGLGIGPMHTDAINPSVDDTLCFRTIQQVLKPTLERRSGFCFVLDCKEY